MDILDFFWTFYLNHLSPFMGAIFHMFICKYNIAFEMSTVAFHDQIYWHVFVCEYIVLWNSKDYNWFHCWIIMISDQSCWTKYAT